MTYLDIDHHRQWQRQIEAAMRQQAPNYWPTMGLEDVLRAETMQREQPKETTPNKLLLLTN